MLAFIHIEGAVGPAVSEILRQSFGLRHCDLQSWRQHAQASAVPRLADLKHAMQFYPVLESISGYVVAPHCGYERLCPEVRYFTLLERTVGAVRGPIRAAGTLLGKSALPFAEWIGQPASRNLMTRKLTGTEDSDDAIEMLERRVGCTGLAERFDESLLLVRRWADRPQLDIRYSPPHGADVDRCVQQLLDDPQSRESLVEANLEDIRLYLYVANELFPRQLAGYGSGLRADLEEFRKSNRPVPRSAWQAASFASRDAVYRRAAQISTALRRAA